MFAVVKSYDVNTIFKDQSRTVYEIVQIIDEEIDYEEIDREYAIQLIEENKMELSHEDKYGKIWEIKKGNLRNKINKLKKSVLIKNELL